MKKAVILVAIGALAAGAYWFFRAGAQPEAGALSFSGNVDIREVSLGFRVGGKLQRVLKDEGDPVREGEELARLDPAPYEHEMAESKARVAAAQAQLELLRAGHREEEIAQARAIVREREATLTNAERLYERLEGLLASSAISVQERDDARARFNEAEARTNSAREQLRLLEAGFRMEEIAAADAEMSRAQAALGGAELRLQDTVLKAPADGVVLTRAQEPGAVLQPGAPVLMVSLRRPVWVRAYAGEPDLGQLHPGMKVTIQTDSRDTAYRGQIGHISPRAEFTPKNVETRELRTSLVYRFRVVVEDPDDALRQGMPVTVKLP